jgi:hypothetical protein
VTDKFAARAEILDEAKAAITQDRNNLYGPPSQNFEQMARMASVLGYSGPGGRELRPHDVSVILILLKLSRLTWSPDSRDSWLDIAGYAACGWQCSAEAKEAEVRKE